MVPIKNLLYQSMNWILTDSTKSTPTHTTQMQNCPSASQPRTGACHIVAKISRKWCQEDGFKILILSNCTTPDSQTSNCTTPDRQIYPNIITNHLSFWLISVLDWSTEGKFLCAGVFVHSLYYEAFCFQVTSILSLCDILVSAVCWTIVFISFHVEYGTNCMYE